MKHAKRSILIGLSGLTLVALIAGTFFLYPRTQAAPKSLGLQRLIAKGSTTFTASNSASSTGGVTLEIGPQAEHEDKTIANTPTIPTTLPTTPPNPKPNGIAKSNPGFTGFNGLSHADQRLADNGNQFSLEPPDQGLCVGGDYVLEAVNTALAVYRASDHALVAGPTALNPFFKLPSEIIRSNPPVFGPFTSDPKCYYDPGTGRWFLSILEIDTDSSTGAFLGHTSVLLAVSQTGNPTGTWSIFAIDTTDDGSNGTPSHAHCPCLGDQPLIGADKYGFYVTTNEFPLFEDGFNGAQVYAISKLGLVAAAEHGGTLPQVVHLDASQALVPYGGLSYSIQPATSPSFGDEPNNGTEYFLSALEFTGTLDNRIAVWALTNTRSLGGDAPDVQLSFTVIKSETYGQPPDATQKAGPIPLGDSVGESLEKLAGNDDRMNQVVFAHGLLWSGLNTIVQKRGGPARVGIAYFVVRPGWKDGSLKATMAGQGYVSVENEHVLFPSIGVNAKGQAVMTFTLSGPDYFPSAAYVHLDAHFEAGKVHIAGAGAGPEDGFSGYAAFGGDGTARWGDYSAAVAGPDGSIWIATEYIPNAPRTSLANWGTFIGKVTPGSHDD